MAKDTREEILELLKQSSPRTRRTVLRVLEGSAEVDNLAFVKETLDFIEPDQTVRSVEFTASRTCTFGHVLDNQNHVVAVAQCCGAVTCSAEGCSLNCYRCFKSLCNRHAHRVGGRTYCRRCFFGGVLRYLVFGKKKEVGP